MQHVGPKQNNHKKRTEHISRIAPAPSFILQSRVVCVCVCVCILSAGICSKGELVCIFLDDDDTEVFSCGDSWDVHLRVQNISL